MADKHEQEAGTPAGKRGGNLKWMGAALLLLLLGVGAGVGGAMMLGGSAEASSGGHGQAVSSHGRESDGEAPGHGEEASGHSAPAAGHGRGEAGSATHDGKSVVNLGLFTVNLRGSGGGRVLRAEIQVEVDAGQHTLVETRKPVLRDAVLTLASDFSYTDLEGLDGKTHLRDELQGRLNTILGGQPRVEHVYFTEFVVQ